MAEDQTLALQGGNMAFPDPLGTIGKLTDIQHTQASTQDLHQQALTREYDLRSQQIARAANEILQTPEGSPERKEMWNHHVDDLYQRGYLNNVEYKQWHNNPSDLVLNQAISRGTPVDTHMGMTGTTAGLSAAKQAPFHPSVHPPGDTVEYPGVRPGAPYTPPTSTVPGVNNSPLDIVPPPRQPAAAASTAGKSKLPYYDEIPSNPVAQAGPTGPGVVSPGINPVAIKAGETGLKELNEEIAPTVKAASQTRASLETMISELQTGKVSTNRLAELRLEVAGFVNGVLGAKDPDGKIASRLVGINLPWAEALNKETTRMGLSYARQTEGAREAVQAIMIALKANPSLLNSVQGNLLIAKTMRAAADYDIERGTAANSYFQKQKDTTQTGHLTGFEPWWNQGHSPGAFISKVIPYPIPESGKEEDLRPGITYTFKDKDGKEVQGVYDARRKVFVH